MNRWAANISGDWKPNPSDHCFNNNNASERSRHENFNSDMILRRLARFCNSKTSSAEHRAINKLVELGVVSPTAASTLVLKQLDGLSNTTFKVSQEDHQQLAKPLTFKWYKNTFSMFVNRELETEIICALAAKG